MGLLCGEGCVILTVSVFDWSTRVTDSGTDRRTDRRTDGRTGVSKERAIAYMLSRAKKYRRYGWLWMFVSSFDKTGMQ